MRDYQFVLPRFQRELVGNQGEQACFLAYPEASRGVTPEGILRELRRQPHMAELAEKLDGERRLYLLESASPEQLFLAASYIGTYHRLADKAVGRTGGSRIEEEDGEGEEEDLAESWRDGDLIPRVVDFGQGIPFLLDDELQRFYAPQEGFGFGDQMFRSNAVQQNRPWWTLSETAPLVVSLVDPTPGTFHPSGRPLAHMPGLLENLRKRDLVIVLYYNRPRKEGAEDDEETCWQDPELWMSMEDLSFELETDCIRLGAPGADSRYKQEVLRQLAREKGTPLAKGVRPLRVLSLIEEHRGDVDNRTIAKSVSNAILRRKSQGPLRDRDFAYLASVFPARKGGRSSEEDTGELVGQPEIRRQMQEILRSMVFQRRRRSLGLPGAPLHYTFAFLGPPGTGKTSWARWLAREMEREGLLENTSSICINAAELKARYVGHTTGRVKALFQQYGVIILDEAYSLAEGEGDDSFAREALAQLCVELEEHGEDRLVIFAGYGGASDPSDNRMLRFLRSNPGINSRVAFRIHFRSFRPQGLWEVLSSMLEREKLSLPPEAEETVLAFFRQRMEDRAFGNCREARNLADRIKLRMAVRVDPEGTREQMSRILPQDVEEAAAEILAECRETERDSGRAIGFTG